MMMGPEPMRRIFLRSVRFGIRRSIHRWSLRLARSAQKNLWILSGKERQRQGSRSFCKTVAEVARLPITVGTLASSATVLLLQLDRNDGHHSACYRWMIAGQIAKHVLVIGLVTQDA